MKSFLCGYVVSEFDGQSHNCEGVCRHFAGHCALNNCVGRHLDDHVSGSLSRDMSVAFAGMM